MRRNSVIVLGRMAVNRSSRGPRHELTRPRRSLTSAVGIVAIAAGAALAVSGASAQGSGAPTRPLLKKYIGNPDTDALLKEPAVRAPLEAMLGKHLPTLIRNLNIKGEVN